MGIDIGHTTSEQRRIGRVRKTLPPTNKKERNTDMAREMAKEQLKKTWAEVVADGSMTEEEMRESLADQIDGYTDLAMEELTEELADLMGYEFGNMTEEEEEEWEKLVNETATEYLNK